MGAALQLRGAAPSHRQQFNALGPRHPLRLLPRRPRGWSPAAATGGGGGGPAKQPKPKREAGAEPWKPPSMEGAALRAEAEAPWRSLRLVLFGFSAVSAALATLFGVPPLLGALGGAPAARPLADVAQDAAINVGALAASGALLLNDLKARDKQISRLVREDALGACQLTLASGRLLRLGQLRGFARPVIVAGTPAQVAAALAAAEPHRAALEARGVLVVPAPVFPGAAAELPPLGPADQRWRADAARLDDWRAWFEEQARSAGKADEFRERGLYVGLRMDGRVRASGVGTPAWAAFAAQLPPVDGAWGGLLDGMDGRV